MEDFEIKIEELEVQTMVNEAPIEEIIESGDIENEDKNDLSIEQ